MAFLHRVALVQPLSLGTPSYRHRRLSKLRVFAQLAETLTLSRLGFCGSTTIAINDSLLPPMPWCYNGCVQSAYRPEKPPMRILRPEQVTRFPEFRELTPEELKEAYRLGREAFTAADLQKYTEDTPGIPFEDMLNELEQAERREDEATS